VDLNRVGYTTRPPLERAVLAKTKAALDAEVPPDAPHVADVMSVVAPGQDKHRVLAMASNRVFGLDGGKLQTSYGLPFQPVPFGAGSVYKIFTAAVALEKGMGIKSIMTVPPSGYASPIYTGGGVRPSPVANAGKSADRRSVQTALAKRQRIPDFFPSLQYSQEGSGQNAIQPPTVTVSVSAAPPLFYRNQGEIAKAEADLRSQQTTANKIEAQVGSDVSTAYAALTSAQSRVSRMEDRLLQRAAVARDLVIAGGCESMSNASLFTHDRWGVSREGMLLHDSLQRRRIPAGGRHYPVAGGMLETAETMPREPRLGRAEQAALAVRHRHRIAGIDVGDTRGDEERIDDRVGNQIGQRVSQTAQGRHQAADDAAHPRPAAASQTAVVGQRLGETHADARAETRGEADQERLLVLMRGKRRREQRRQR